VPEAISPYRGLTPFTEADAPFFFGRERECELIIANLMASRLTLLYGQSGVGKSSVLNAGVARSLNALARKNLAEQGSPELVAVVFRNWRDDPLKALAGTLVAETRKAAPGSPDPDAGLRLDDLLADCAERVNGDVFLILDQFEEYFLYHAGEDGEGSFAVEFPRAVNRAGLRAYTLLSLREDCLARLDCFKRRLPQLFRHYLRTPHPRVRPLGDRQAAQSVQPDATGLPQGGSRTGAGEGNPEAGGIGSRQT
jgi:hypothetical protein